MSRVRTVNMWLHDGEYEVWQESEELPEDLGFQKYLLWVKPVSACLCAACREGES